MHRTILLIILSLCGGLVQAQSGGGESAASPYFEIATPFVVNIRSENGMNFLQVNAQLKLSRPDLRTKVTLHLPAIQHLMILVLSEQNSKVIRSAEGKQQLRDQSVKELQTFLQKEIGEPAIDEILFTGFIIQ